MSRRHKSRGYASSGHDLRFGEGRGHPKRVFLSDERPLRKWGASLKDRLAKKRKVELSTSTSHPIRSKETKHGSIEIADDRLNSCLRSKITQGDDQQRRRKLHFLLLPIQEPFIKAKSSAFPDCRRADTHHGMPHQSTNVVLQISCYGTRAFSPACYQIVTDFCPAPPII